jgi:hypothetical protein
MLCTRPDNAESLRGKIALTLRGGGCSFSAKALMAQEAGAIGVVVGNSDNEIFTLADDGAGHAVGITMEMITSEDFALLYQACHMKQVVVVSIGRQIDIGPYLV